MKLKVSSIQNNQYIIEFNTELYFQSYDTLIAKIENNGEITLSDDWNYSRTTSKYLYKFLRTYSSFYWIKSKKDILKLIKDNEIRVVKDFNENKSKS